ncbi:MAG: choice-of-anchor I family protein, partial [Faecalibacillus sp.]
MKKQTLFLMPMVMIMATLTASPVYAADANHILINQIYGTGGKTDCAVSHNFIELYNPTDTDVTLAGYEIRYNGSTLDLNDVDTVKAHSSYLIVGKEATNSSPALTITQYDFLKEDFELSNKENTIELMKNDVRIDGIQTSETSQDGIEGLVLTGLSKQKSARRKNFEDTDINSQDFTIVEYKGMSEDSIKSVYPRSSKDGAWTQNKEDVSQPGTTEEETTEQATVNTNSVNGVLKYLGSYSTGAQNEDGGVAEIVKYNSDNQKMYLVSGQFQSVDIVSLKDTQVDQKNSYQLDKRLDIQALALQHGFTCSDITSVDINTKLDIIAIAVQGEHYSDNGSIVLFDYDGNYITHFEAGCQPDMITFTKDGKYALTANEGEPREGYNGKVDPKGSITVLTLNEKDVTKSETQTYDFSEFDSQRDELVNNGVLLKKNTAPSVDLEPEYISVSSDNKKAYVSLQEANAVATFDLETRKWQSIKGLGFKDHSVEGNGLDLNKDGKINIQNENVLGIYMPDGLASVTIHGVDYILTPNEGDAREWAEYSDISEKKINGSEKKVELVNPREFDGLDESKDYLFGGRSFSIFKADTMELVYDSGSDFEKIIAEKYPDIFNSNHKELTVDGRS